MKNQRDKSKSDVLRSNDIFADAVKSMGESFTGRCPLCGGVIIRAVMRGRYYPQGAAWKFEPWNGISVSWKCVDCKIEIKN